MLGLEGERHGGGGLGVDGEPHGSRLIVEKDLAGLSRGLIQARLLIDGGGLGDLELKFSDQGGGGLRGERGLHAKLGSRLGTFRVADFTASVVDHDLLADHSLFGRDLHAVGFFPAKHSVRALGSARYDHRSVGSDQILKSFEREGRGGCRRGIIGKTDERVRLIEENLARLAGSLIGSRLVRRGGLLHLKINPTNQGGGGLTCLEGGEAEVHISNLVRSKEKILKFEVRVWRSRRPFLMSQPIILSTNRDRDTGVVLLFLSLVFYFMAPPLAQEFGLSRGTTALVSTPIGLLLMVLGIAGIFLSRKSIKVKPGQVTIKDGFLARSLHLGYETTPTIKLSVYEEQKSNGRVDEIWTVHLIDDGRQYLVDRRVGQHIACRSLAERLAKATQGSLIETHEGHSQKFELTELDLPFVVRAEKYPALMGQPVEEPADKVVNYRRDAQGIEVSWSFFRSGLFMELLTISACLVAAAFIPLPGGPKGQGFSLYDAERAQSDYRYFIAVGIFTVVAMLLLVGYRNRIVINPSEGATSESTVWGLVVRRGKIPLEKLEHVGVNINSRGPYLQLISDERILKEMLPSTHIARWLAWDIRQYLAGLGGASLKG